MLVPPDPVARPEGLEQLGRILDQRADDLERAWHVCRAVLDGECECVLVGERELTAGRIVLDEPAGGLGAQPLAHVPRVGVRPRRQLFGNHRPGGRHRLVEAEPVPDEHERRVHRGPISPTILFMNSFSLS
jgi:hypothetical protein